MRGTPRVRTFLGMADGLLGWWGHALTCLRTHFTGSQQTLAAPWRGFTTAWATQARHRGRHQLCLSSLTRSSAAIGRAREASASGFFCWSPFDRFGYGFRALAIALPMSFDRFRSLCLCLSSARDRFAYVFRSLSIALPMSFDRSRCLAIAFQAFRSLCLCLSIAFDRFDYVFRSLSIANTLSEFTVDNRAGYSLALACDLIFSSWGTYEPVEIWPSLRLLSQRAGTEPAARCFLLSTVESVR